MNCLISCGGIWAKALLRSGQPCSRGKPCRGNAHSLVGLFLFYLYSLCSTWLFSTVDLLCCKLKCLFKLKTWWCIQIMIFAGRGKMTSGNMISMTMMNPSSIVWIDYVILICKYKLLLLLDADSWFYGFWLCVNDLWRSQGHCSRSSFEASKERPASWRSNWKEFCSCWEGSPWKAIRDNDSTT